jgi:hypothetical protein
MVKDISVSEINDVIGLLRPIIEEKGAAGINYGVRIKFGCGRDDMEDHIIDKVRASIVRSGEYISEQRDKSRHGHDYNIFRNPSFELSENARRTNNSLRISTVFIAIATVVNVIVASIPLFKNNDAALRLIQQSTDGLRRQIEEIKKVQESPATSWQKFSKDGEKDSTSRSKNNMTNKKP